MAARYWVGGGSSQNWSATGNTNWGTASGVQDNASVPTSVDDVIFDGAGAAGNSNSTISATITVKSLTISSGYTATMTHNAVLTVAGNWTMSNTHTIAGTSGINISSTATITSNAQTWPNDCTLSTNTTKTISGNLTISGYLIISSPGNTVNKTTSEVINCNGLTVNGNTSGTILIVLKSGVWSGTGELYANLNLDGNITVSGTVTVANVLTYISGIITTTGSTLRNTGLGSTINTPPNTAVSPSPDNGVNWDTYESYRFNQNAGSVTYAAPFQCNNFVSSGFAGSNNGIGSSTNRVIVLNSVTNNAVINGSFYLEVRGGSIYGTITTPIEINGNVSINSALSCNNFYYISGTVTVSATVTFTFASEIQSGPIQFSNVVFTIVNQNSGAGTLLSDMYILGTLTINGKTFYSVTINGSSYKIYCNGLDCTASPNTFGGTATVVLTGGTLSSSGTISVNLTFDSGVNTVTVSSTIIYSSRILKYTSGTVTTTGSTLTFSSCTLDTNGITWNNLIYNGGTSTLTSNLTGANLTVQTGGVINKTTSEVITLSNGLTLTGSFDGSTNVTLTGGTWSGTSGFGLGITGILTLNGNVTISGTVVYANGTIKYVSGTVTTTGSTLSIRNTVTITFDTFGITWNNVSTSSSGATFTLQSNFICSGTFTTSSGNVTVNRTTAETFSIGGLNIASILGGTAEVILTGGTWSGSGTVVSNFTLNGNSTISGSVSYRTGTLKYVSGTITTTGSTLNLTFTCTLDTFGISWNNVTTSNTLYTYTINSLLSIGGTLTIGTGGSTFDGTAGFICSTLLNAGTGVITISLKDGNTYTVTSSLNCYQSRTGSIVTFTSSSATVKAILTLQNGAACNCLANFTRIDASQGRPIYTFNGTITNCDNIKAFNDLKTIASSYV